MLRASSAPSPASMASRASSSLAGDASRSVRGSARAFARARRPRAMRCAAEIRTRDAVQRAAEELGISVTDARDERKLKRAFRASAMRTHPDIAGDSSVEAFKVVQGAYRTLRAAALELEGSAIAAAALVDEEGDVEWAEHDWRWKARYGDGGAAHGASTSRRKTEEEKRAEVRSQVNRMKFGDANGGVATKRGKRKIKPISQQRIPTAEEVRAMESDAKTAVGKGRASRSSTNSAHDALNAQLLGLHRKKNIKARVEGIKTEANGTEEAETELGVHYSTIRAIEDSEEERFLRLAKIAKEWRSKQANWRDSGNSDKMSPKELLQAAVQGASLGACA